VKLLDKNLGTFWRICHMSQSLCTRRSTNRGINNGELCLNNQGLKISPYFPFAQWFKYSTIHRWIYVLNVVRKWRLKLHMVAEHCVQTVINGKSSWRGGGKGELTADWGKKSSAVRGKRGHNGSYKNKGQLWWKTDKKTLGKFGSWHERKPSSEKAR
jgi:hypothetical protein